MAIVLLSFLDIFFVQVRFCLSKLSLSLSELLLALNFVGLILRYCQKMMN
jgi:hypothetical protein